MKTVRFFAEETEFFKKKLIESLQQDLIEVGEGRLTPDEVADKIRASAHQINLPDYYTSMLLDKLHAQFPITMLAKPNSR